MSITTIHSSPSTDLRVSLSNIIRGAFSKDDLIEIRPGRMHASMQGPRAAISPLSEDEGRLVLDQNTAVVVQLFLPWREGVDPNYTADSAVVETYAEKIREAVYAATHPYPGSAGLWDFRVLKVSYGQDPTGQVTRFEMLVQGIGQNFAETTT